MGSAFSCSLIWQLFFDGCIILLYYSCSLLLWVSFACCDMRSILVLGMIFVIDCLLGVDFLSILGLKVISFIFFENSISSLDLTSCCSLLFIFLECRRCPIWTPFTFSCKTWSSWQDAEEVDLLDSIIELLFFLLNCFLWLGLKVHEGCNYCILYWCWRRRVSTI